MLLQEQYRNDEFKLLIACILLNQTNGKEVRKYIYNFFDNWPTPDACLAANIDSLRDAIRPLGFQNKRTLTILRFCREYLAGDYSDIRQLYGIGKYAYDSHEIFVKGNLAVEPTDKELLKYLRGEFVTH